MIGSIMISAEDQIHKSIVKYLKIQYKDDIIHHSPNEGNRGGKKGMRDGAHRKAMGVCAGFPDIIMPMRLWAFEVKAPRKYATPEQKIIRDMLVASGWKWCLVRSIDDVVKAIEEWNDANGKAT